MAATSTSFESRAPKLGFVPSFDGIRGLGVCLVLLQHAYPVADSFSSIVDLFFVISGFLITTLLFEEHSKTNHISLRNFYVRRGLRLLPALIVVLVLGYVAILVARPDFAKQAGLESLAALFYVHNIFYNPIFGSVQYLGPMWSLSVEEQFYFVVSILMFLVVPRDKMKPVFTALLGFYLFVNVSRILGHMGPGQVWFHRPDACAIGMMAAIVNAWLPKEFSPKAMKRVMVLAWTSGFALFISLITSSEFLREKFGFGVPFLPSVSKDISSKLEDAASSGKLPSKLVDEVLADALARLPERWYWVRWGFTLGSISGAILTVCVVRLGPKNLLNKMLSTRWFRYLGRASFALYICHYQIYLLLGGGLPGGPKIQAIQKILIALAVGLALHRFVERPALKLKDRFSFLRTTAKPSVPAE